MTAAPAIPTAPPVARPVTTLWGVGPERAAQLARLNISTIADLLLHRPRRYEDRRRFRPIRDLLLDEPATTRGRVVALGVKRFRHGEKSVFELILDDGTARLHCRWWNLPFMEKYFAVDDEVVVFGRPLSLKPRTMDHPETEVVEAGGENFIHLNRITPVYPLTEGLPQRWLRSLIWRTLEQFGAQIAEPNYESGLSRNTQHATRNTPQAHDAQPSTAVPGPSFPSRANAVRMIHFPEALEDIETARRRLALDEFVELQLGMRARRKKFEANAKALPCGGDNRLIKPFLAALGFSLTGAQTGVLREIRAGLRGAHPMRRLLQGDVGSGKTVVAACSALMAIESGFNVALMAPTEILAEQHYQNFKKWFGPLGVGVELQTGSRKTVEGRASMVESPEPSAASHLALISQSPSTHPQSAIRNQQLPRLTHLVIGTHALLTAGYDLPRLGLVIVDEQHKFGVAQREQLVRKGSYPHLLVMTATPIPRTLGLTVYGELDVSTINQPPEGRGRIQTFVRAADKLPKVWAFVREKLAQGRQAYVVYPRVEDVNRDGIKAVTREFSSIEKLLAPHAAGLLHGRLKPREKDEVMSGFRAGAIKVLLATSLIEVGVDVPNATIMVIENAEQFGLAQLHQLRGRIGRGAHDSFCILVSAAKNDEARSRLRILEETADGFRIAEADLKLRGPGELLGQQQSGVPDFRFGDLAADWELIQLARQMAARFDP